VGWVLNTPPRPLYLREIDPAPIAQEVRWAPGSVGKGAGSLAPPTGIRSPDCPACSESLYRLSYPGPLYTITNTDNQFHSCNKEPFFIVRSLICFLFPFLLTLLGQTRDQAHVSSKSVEPSLRLLSVCKRQLIYECGVGCILMLNLHLGHRVNT
jgi:hypothetical protein